MNIADINTLARFLSDTDTTSLTAANLLIFVNKAYERIIGKILTKTAGGDFPFGDKNYTAFPTFTFSMTNGTQSYDLNDLTTDPLVILGLEVQDQSGDWHPLTRTSLKKIRGAGIAQPEYYSTNGRPEEYELRDNMIVLYPAPDNGVSVTLSNGLRMYYLRKADSFTSGQVSTGTKEPGFPSPWHDILAYEAAEMYCLNYKKDRVPYLKSEREKREKELMDFLSIRDQDSRPIMTPKRISFI